MNNPTPKQFLEVAGKPLLMHTCQAFLRYAPDLEIVLVLPEAFFDYWQSLCKKYRFHPRHEMVISGPTRFHSVKNGLKQVAEDALVAIHDGVRPLVSLETIGRGFHFAEKFGNAIPVVPVSESVRITENALSKTLPREKIRLVQTPQCFQARLIKKAYNQNYNESFTDDAAVMEADGHRIFLIDGNPENIKITTPADLRMAAALIGKK